MGKKSKRTKPSDLKDQFIKNLKALTNDILLKRYVDEDDLLKKIRDISEECYLLNKKSSLQDYTEVRKLMPIIGEHYIKLLGNNYTKIIIKDIETLSMYSAFIPAELNDFFQKTYNDFLGSNHKMPKDYDDIIVSILKTNRQKMDPENILYYINRGFPKLAHYAYKEPLYAISRDLQERLQKHIFSAAVNAFFGNQKHYDIDYLSEVVDLFRDQIDLYNTYPILKHARSLVPYSTINLFYAIQDESIKLQYIKLLCHTCEYDFNHNQIEPVPEVDSALDFFKTLPPLFLACYFNDKRSVEQFLKYKADINYILKLNDKVEERVYTPFSIAVSSSCKNSDDKKIDFLEFLIKKGANPLIAAELDGKRVSNMFNISVPIFCITGSVSKFSDKYKNYLLDLFENYYLKLLSESFGDYENSSKSDSKKPSAPEQNDKVKEIKVPNLLESYIDFKQNVLAIKSIEDKLDLLALKQLQNPSAANLEALQLYIATHPELDHYPVTSLLQKGYSAENSSEVLTYQPKLLHKFFQIKEKSSASHKASDMQEPYTPTEGIFTMKSGLKNKAYITITQQIKDEISPELLNKFTSQLSNCSFIKSNSKGMAGVKMHNGLIRLKLASENISLSTDTKYIDKDGNILIILDTMRTHKTTIGSKGAEIKIHQVDSFNDLFRSDITNCILGSEDKDELHSSDANDATEEASVIGNSE